MSSILVPTSPIRHLSKYLFFWLYKFKQEIELYDFNTDTSLFGQIIHNFLNIRSKLW